MLALDRSHMKAHVERHYPGGWDDKNARSLIEDNLQRAKVLVFEGRLVGFYYWSDDEPNIAGLHSIQVGKEHRGRGLGTWLMACFEMEAKAKDKRFVELAVFEDNPAQRLYERLGYQVSGQDGPHALEMRKVLVSDEPCSNPAMRIP